ncbi:FAS1-like dehydratase domain-containing protein [Novosphingobium aquimarinum]|uniref:FAS1-like dehydratase domain-containing protein n=1 Tax=Novosphingobium aquimarinum TaxID=2682494 RepID=UPI001E4C67D0|nr:MaoC family dehydratase N-terminal domain-containing protein [Novosphingobium aquimarinum]
MDDFYSAVDRLCFLPDDLQSAIDVDGHPKRGGFLPPIPLPRRMWAGGRLEFLAPLRIGEKLERISTIAAIKQKTGATGQLMFVTVRHEISGGGGLAVIEEQDLVYREAETETSAAKKPSPAASSSPEIPDVQRSVVPDPTMLQRFSALTFNAHRIHYDRAYARDVEHYGGLVVHGPLIATLLMDLWLREDGTRPASFSFRAQRPLLDTAPFDLCLQRKAGGAKLWSRDAEGNVTMSAEVRTDA